MESFRFRPVSIAPVMDMAPTQYSTEAVKALGEAVVAVPPDQLTAQKFPRAIQPALNVQQLIQHGSQHYANNDTEDIRCLDRTGDADAQHAETEYMRAWEDESRSLIRFLNRRDYTSQ